VYRAAIHIFLGVTSGSLSAENCVAVFGSSEDESNSIVRQSQKGSKAARMTQAVRARCRTEAWKPYPHQRSDKGLVPQGGTKAWGLGSKGGTALVAAVPEIQYSASWDLVRKVECMR
jgi:hypothetical protein